MDTAPTSSPTLVPPTLPVTHVLRRAHDDSVISGHCSLACARSALERVSLAAMAGANPPGPLEWVTAHLVDLASGQVLEFTGGLVPVDGAVDGAAALEARHWP
jgi:hypothetical protein